MSQNLDLDFQRAARCGFPEVIFGQGKTVEEILAAISRLHAAHGKVLATRLAPDALAALTTAFPAGTPWPRGRCFTLGAPTADGTTLGPVAVLSAGTADRPVVDECLATLAIRGIRAEVFADCGIAGLHRLLHHLEAIRACRAVIAIAGMEGALPSVVGGLVDLPVIGVPTSVGYGIADGGRTALHAMLTSCAAGVVAVNIDNGFGAAMHAAAICGK